GDWRLRNPRRPLQAARQDERAGGAALHRVPLGR
ncbi:MAG: hypothetical protein AVDCRST_MAG90-2006, partial [uncultured Microvirga sp.]